MKKKILVIVESPTKIKTLKKFLSDDYLIESSVGHIRDLPKKGFGIDIENDFSPIYEPLPEKKEVIANLKKSAKNCSKILLAPDPDREGEAIAWHIQTFMPKGIPTQRISFNAITKDAVLEAIANPRDIDQALVDAQQARRLLDRVVGYKISPILQRRISTGTGMGLSAGRVQSIALKLVVDREKLIDAFVPVEYWLIDVDLQKKQDPTIFSSYLYSVDGLKVEKEPIEGKKTYQITNEVEAAAIKTRLNNTDFTVDSVVKRQKKRNPVPPFITSTLQQEASRHHGFSASRTMSIAQSLYEGVDMGKLGSEGLITYMRTDSIRSAPEAINSARNFILSTYGKDFLPAKANYYKSKKNTQDAHEAIRPTNVSLAPEKVQSFLTIDQFKLYSLVYKRFVSSQMMPAVYDTLTCDIKTNNGLLLRTTGSIILFKGFLAAYEEKTDDDESASSTTDQIGKQLPLLEEGQTLMLKKLNSAQTFTKPPPRFSEASLVKELEKQGIGRPSTYASIMSKIQSRSYTTKERLTIKPTELGKIIAQMLESHFSIIMDIAFTANMETELDEIADNKKEWKSFLNGFWKQFSPIIEKALEEAFVPKIATDIDCPKCGKKLQKIWAKDKYFYGCSGYPDCKFTVPIEALEFKREDYAEKFNWDQNCPKCGAAMKIRFGRYGAFLGCTQYPDCNGIVNIPKKGEKLPEEMPPCPAIGCDGRLVQRTSRWGKPFFSCSNYPDCNVIANSPEQVISKYPNHPKTAYVKKAKKGVKGAKKTAKKSAKKTVKKKKAVARNMPKYNVSKELGSVIGTDPIERTTATKKLWDYIKANNLQDPNHKRSIVPDGKLSKVFGSKEPIDMMKLAGILSKHLEK